MGILDLVAGAAAEAGTGLGRMGLSSILRDQEAAVQAERDKRLEGFASAREGRGYAHQEKAQDKGILAQKDLQSTSIASSEKIHEQSEKGQDRRTEAQLASREKIAENALASSQKIAGMSNAIANGQLSLATARDKIDNELKTINLNNAKQVEELRKEYVKPGVDSARKQEIQDAIQLLTGKDNDNIVPLPEKDELGNTTYSKAWDKKRGRIVSMTEAVSGGTGGTGGVQIGTGADAGKVMVDGVLIPGTANTPAEVRALVAKYRSDSSRTSSGLINSGAQ